MASPVAITDSEFEQVVLRTGTPVLVEFWATWCASCRMLAPVIDALETDYAGRVAVVKINVEESLEYAERYGVRQTPTVLVFRNGEEVERPVGAGEKPLYVAKLEGLLAE
jgi:thioredoxin 1